MLAESEIEKVTSGLSTAESRWARFGPYYAMFPVEFAFNVVRTFTQEGDTVLDPFAGRFTSIFAASALARKGIGIEINPVGWIYGRAKLDPPPVDRLLERLYEIDCCKTSRKHEMETLPLFFSKCYCEPVLMFLLSAKRYLAWRRSSVDATLMAHILIYLHGKAGQSLSNQMMMTKAMGPQYSIRWWEENGYNTPPEIDAYSFLKQRIEWRYAKGLPKLGDAHAVLGDSMDTLRRSNTHISKSSPFSLLFTSPPYYGVVNYYTDQWLRMWMLGGADRPAPSGNANLRRFDNREHYRKMLAKVFTNASSFMARKSTIFVRTDARSFTFETTRECLLTAFPSHKMHIVKAPLHGKTQTRLFGDYEIKPGEIDIILQS
jgi:DNA modification methylase